jgi:hypothetical protein
MAVPKVFISSTCYDLADVRDSLVGFIRSFGLEPVLSDKGDVFYHPDLHTHDSCLRETDNCQLFLLLIGGRFGGAYVADTKKSIVNAEWAAAKSLQMPVFSFVKRDVMEDHRIFQKNKANAKAITFPAIENQAYASHIFRFIDEVRLSPVNNGLFRFEYTRDIEETLRKQWAGMLFDFLKERKLRKEIELSQATLGNLTIVSEKIEELVKLVYRHVDVKSADKTIVEIDKVAEAKQFFSKALAALGLPKFKTSLSKLEKIDIGISWYNYLGRIEGFEIKHLSHADAEGSESGESDNVVSNETHHCLTFHGDMTDDEIQQAKELEKHFSNFRQLTPEQRKIVLQAFV